MANYIIYSQPNCAVCEQAKAYLKNKNIEYVELILNVGQVQEEGKTYVPVTHLKERAPNARTVPQIFDGKKHIGDFNALKTHLSKVT
jgi:glutaredoxin 3